MNVEFWVLVAESLDPEEAKNRTAFFWPALVKPKFQYNQSLNINSGAYCRYLLHVLQSYTLLYYGLFSYKSKPKASSTLMWGPKAINGPLRRFCRL